MKEAKTVEEWKAKIKENAKGTRGRFKILSRDMFYSDAFLALTGPECVALLAAWDQIEFEPQKKSRKQKQGGKSRPVIRNGGRVYLPQNLLKALGIKSSATITKVRKRLVELGFLDVLETGTVHGASVFKVSERWTHYPDGPYQAQDNRPAGLSLYGKGLKDPDHPLHQRRSKKLHSPNECNPYVQQMNTATDPPFIN
jgi:hypothetical protein